MQCNLDFHWIRNNITSSLYYQINMRWSDSGFSWFDFLMRFFFEAREKIRSRVVRKSVFMLWASHTRTQIELVYISPEIRTVHTRNLLDDPLFYILLLCLFIFYNFWSNVELFSPNIWKKLRKIDFQNCTLDWRHVFMCRDPDFSIQKLLSSPKSTFIWSCLFVLVISGSGTKFVIHEKITKRRWIIYWLTRRICTLCMMIYSFPLVAYVVCDECALVCVYKASNLWYKCQWVSNTRKKTNE